MPLSEVVKGSPVIITGTIETEKGTKNDTDKKIYTSHIKVDKVLKNTLPDYSISAGDKLPLSQPKILTSKSITYKAGTSGIWILEYHNKTFWATYPKDYQKLDHEADISKLISSENK